MARSRRRVGKERESSPKAAPEPEVEITGSVDIGFSDSEPEPEPEPKSKPRASRPRASRPKAAAAPPPQRKARPEVGGDYETIAHVRFTDREVPPGTKLTLTDEQARRLMKIGAVKPMED